MQPELLRLRLFRNVQVLPKDGARRGQYVLHVEPSLCRDGLVFPPYLEMLRVGKMSNADGGKSPLVPHDGLRGA